MKKPVTLWILALIITLASANYQRITGPTYPLEDEVIINGKTLQYEFFRSHGGTDDHTVFIPTIDDFSAFVYWKRFKTNDEWNIVKMKEDDGKLTAYLPHQPPAGKLVYKVVLKNENKEIELPENEPVIIRFKGDVPAYILIPHIIFIFSAMLFSTRTGIEFFREEPKYKKLTLWTFVLLILGGMIFGPITQYYAFGAFWTGFPFGMDLTDNKTLIALIGWIIALVAVFKAAKPGKFVLGAAILMLIVYLIPHSLLGSELDYNKLDNEKPIHQNYQPE